MDKKKIIAVTGILLVLSVIVLAKFIKKPEKEAEVHYHAGLVVFENGQKVDFSDSKYMFIKPCTPDGKEIEDEKTKQMEKAHLHGGVGDVVHVEAENPKWGDLFTNIGYPLNYASVSAYINGTKVGDIKNIPIKANDSLVLLIGSVNESLLSQAVTVERIKEVESTSIECGD